MSDKQTVLVTGGAGYVGSALVPYLLECGYRVRVLDLYIFGDEALSAVRNHSCLEELKGDIRDEALLRTALRGCGAVIHLACISNDPSFELDPELGKSINYEAFPALVDIARDSGVRRFIYASSSSVYGVRAEPNVTENLALTPLTDYSKYKAMCEDVLLAKREAGFEVVVFRPATVCGYAPRLRLDLVVNILTSHAVNNRVITVVGGTQMRPNIHIADIVDLYTRALDWPTAKVDGVVYNVGYENHPVSEIAEIVRGVVGEDVKVVTRPTDDARSYHISSAKIKRNLGFEAKHTVSEAVADLESAMREGRVPEAMFNPRYYNIRTMQQVTLR